MKRRNTIQRGLVLEAVRLLPHPTAEDVHIHVASAHPAVSRGTVYRNLNILAAKGLVRKVTVPDAADHFDHTLANHYHIHCRLCGRVVDADIPYQQDLPGNIVEDHGFLIESHDIVFTGICPDCRPAGKTVQTVNL